jgi:Domain of unknown function (DUF4406)
VKLYIAGPMTGLPEFNYPAFREASRALFVAGYATEDPSTHDGKATTWDGYMRLALPQMLRCDGVATLPRWWRSRGARLEVHVASSLDMPVLPVEEWLANAAGIAGLGLGGDVP